MVQNGVHSAAHSNANCMARQREGISVDYQRHTSLSLLTDTADRRLSRYILLSVRFIGPCSVVIVEE